MSTPLASVHSVHSVQLNPLHAEKKEEIREQKKNSAVGKTVRTVRSLRSNFARLPKNTYDPCAPVQWPHIILASAEKYGPFSVAIALRKLHALGKLHDPTHCPVCRGERRDKAA